MKKNKIKYGVTICLILGLSAVFGACHFKEANKDASQEKESYTKLKVVTMGSYGSADTFEEVREEINKITREMWRVWLQYNAKIPENP